MAEVGVPQLLSRLGGEQQRVEIAVGDEGAQTRHEEARDGDRPCSMVLWGVRMQPARDLYDVGADVDTPPVEIQVTDTKRRHLPKSQSCVGEEIDQRVVLGRALLCQPSHLVVGEEALLPDRLTR